MKKPEDYGITNYKWSKEGLLDVDGDVNLNDKGLDKLPFKFGKVSGGFDCWKNQLVSLEGAPKTVGGNFDCSYNKLKTLEGAPKEVGGNFDCSYNKLKTLEGAPKFVKGKIIVDDNLENQIPYYINVNQVIDYLMED